MLFRHLENEAVLLDLKSGTYFGLNEVGARAWHLIVERGSLAQVLEALLDEFDGEREIVERDLLALAAQLIARNLASVTAHAG